MKKTNTNGFATTELLVALAVVVIIGVVGGVVYRQDHKTKATPTSSQTNTKSSTQSKSASTTSTPPADPYAGWKTASLKYEQATFKYPGTWQITNMSKNETETGGTATPGADSVTLTSPTGLIVSMSTGLPYTVDETGMASILSGAQPISALGSSYYLDFYTNNSSSTNSTDATRACLGTTATATNNENAPYIISKYIQLAGEPDDPAADLVCIEYDSSGGHLVAKPVSTFEQDASYNDAKLIVESLAY